MSFPAHCEVKRLGNDEELDVKWKGSLTPVTARTKGLVVETLRPPPPPPIAQETKHTFMCLTGGGVLFSRLIDSGSWRRSCWDQSRRQPATRSQRRHMTRTRVARLADSAVTSPQMAARYVYLRFFFGRQRQASLQVIWALFSLALPPSPRLLCSSVFPLWNSASAPLSIYFFKCMKDCFKLPNMSLAAAALAAAGKPNSESPNIPTPLMQYT